MLWNLDMALQKNGGGQKCEKVFKGGLEYVP